MNGHTTPYLHAAILPPPCLIDTIARMQAQIDALAAEVAALKANRRPVRCVEFTARENDVLAEFVGGATSNKMLARQLVISVYTVQTHIERILMKAGVPDRAALMLWAMRQRAPETTKTPLPAI